MLLDPLTVEAGEDGRWRHAPFPGDADAPAQNIDLPDRMGVRIDAHEASGRVADRRAWANKVLHKLLPEVAHVKRVVMFADVLCAQVSPSM